MKKEIYKKFLAIIASFVRILNSLALTKFAAFYFSERVFTSFNQVQNFSNILQSGLNSISGTALTKHYDEDIKKEVISSTFTAIWLVQLIITVIGFVILGINKNVLLYNYGILKYSILLVPIFSAPFVVFSNLEYIKQRLERFVCYNLLYLIICIPIAFYSFRVYGAEGIIYFLLIANLTTSIIVYIINRSNGINLRHTRRSIVHKILRTTYVSIIVSFLGIGSLILTRYLLNQSTDQKTIIEWDVIIKLTFTYNFIINAIIQYQILPELRMYYSNNKTLFHKKMRSSVLSIILIWGGACTVIYFMSDFLVILFFNESFSGNKKFLLFQMINDFIRILGMFLSNVIILTAFVYKKLIITEIIVNIFLISMVFLLINSLKVYGYYIADFLKCILYIILIKRLYNAI